jgi:NADH:ubiquinone oxidoreductase subunit 4 (subunit M)
MMFGSLTSYISSAIDLTKKEFHMLLPLFFLSTFLGIYPNILIETIDITSMSYLI